jgi:hypothetical protein
MTVIHTPEPESAFFNADYYATSEDFETLEHETPSAAIEELVDGNSHRGGALGSISFLGTITVYAYQRKSVNGSDWVHLGKRAAEKMAEWFDDEYGGSDESVLSRTGVHKPTLDAELGEVFKRHVTDSGKTDPVWQCERVGERAYSSAEVEALMREENPQWFTEAKP